MAYVNEADLQARTGKLDEALQLYQRALRLDDSIDDSESEAADWASYGRFLDQAGFSPRLAYACIVKSRAEAKTASRETLPDSVQETRERLEKQLGATAEAIRRNPDPALQEALTLRR
jgi:tetratricopeptide (TPR) repeat protein